MSHMITESVWQCRI